MYKRRIQIMEKNRNKRWYNRPKFGKCDEVDIAIIVYECQV